MLIPILTKHPLYTKIFCTNILFQNHEKHSLGVSVSLVTVAKWMLANIWFVAHEIKEGLLAPY